MNLKRMKISLVFNILIVLCTIFALIVKLTKFSFMPGDEIILSDSLVEIFRFFTVDSNLLMAIIAFIFACFEISVLLGKKKDIPKNMYVFKLMGTVGVTLTFLVVFLYLSWIVKGGAYTMIINSNLFLHLINPLLSIITFVFFEKSDKLKFSDTFLGLVPMGLYGIYYLGNVITHVENGKVPFEYDWYCFVQNGLWHIVIVLPLIFVVTYISSYLLWKFNKKKAK